MQEEKEELEELEEELPKRQKKSTKVLVLLIAVVAVILVLGIVFLALKPNVRNEQVLSQARPSAFEVEPPLEVFPPTSDPALSFEVNLADEAERHILVFRFRIGYSALSGSSKELTRVLNELSSRRYEISDMVTKILMDKKSDELRGRDKIEELEQELLDTIRAICDPGVRRNIKKILVEKILIQ